MSKVEKILLTIFLLFFAFTLITLLNDTKASTNSVYVSNTGSNSLGDGSKQNPWRTIQYASYQSLSPGTTVCIEPGEYDEYVGLGSSGSEVVPIKYGVTVNKNRVYFPSGVDLSSVSTDGSDYVYVYRSRYSNNGVYKITAKGSNFVEIFKNYYCPAYVGSNCTTNQKRERPDLFLPESGRISDDLSLSASIGRPIVYTKCTNDPNQEVVIRRGFYVEKKDYNIIDRISIRNSSQGFNFQEGGSFNVVQNSVVDTLTNMNGIQIGVSTNEYPAKYNMIINNEIYDPLVEGIYVGAGGQGEINNHTDYTHIIDNEIHTSLNDKKLENAIDLKEHNRGSVVEGNYIHDIELKTSGNGVIDVRTDHDGVMIYNNTIKDIHSLDTIPYQAVFRTYSSKNLEIFNNVVYNSNLDSSNTIIGWFAKAGIGTTADFYNNTLHNLDQGLLIEVSGGDYRMYNNIFSGVGSQYVTVYDDTGDFDIKNNLFTSTPNWTPTGNIIESGRIVSANVNFANTAAGDFRISNGSAATDVADTSLYSKYDFKLTQRVHPPDIGAFEHESSLSSFSLHQSVAPVTNQDSSNVKTSQNNSNPVEDTLKSIDALNHTSYNAQGSTPVHLIETSGVTSIKFKLLLSICFTFIGGIIFLKVIKYNMPKSS